MRFVAHMESRRQEASAAIDELNAAVVELNNTNDRRQELESTRVCNYAIFNKHRCMSEALGTYIAIVGCSTAYTTRLASNY